MKHILAQWEEGSRQLMNRDPALAVVIRALGPPTPVLNGDPYLALARAILGQQLAPRAAQAIWERFQSAGGNRGEWVAQATIPQLRACGISQRKAESLQELAQAFGDSAFGAHLLHGEIGSVEERLTAIRGIGQWTFHMFLIFCRGEIGVLPVGDYGVRRGLQRLRKLEELPKPKELPGHVKQWKGWESVGSWYLWKGLDKDLI